MNFAVPTCLRAVAFNMTFMLWTVFIALAYMPAFVFYPRGTHSIGHYWAKGAYFLLRHICNIRFHVRGERNIRYSQVIYACKHQSALDIISMYTLFPRAVFVLKRELLLIPFFGWYLWRMQMIYINRKGGTKALKRMLAAGRRVARDMRPIIIFPEGTRIPPGTRGQYHPGIAIMYQELKLPVVPVSFNTGLYWKRNKWDKQEGTAMVEFLPAIEPGLKPREFLKRMEEAIETSASGLYQEGLHAITQTKEAA